MFISLPVPALHWQYAYNLHLHEFHMHLYSNCILTTMSFWMWHAEKNWIFIHQIKYWFHQFLTTRLYSSVLFCVCICIPLFMTVRAAALYPHLLVFVPNIYFNADILHKTLPFHTFSFKILSNCSLFACFVKISGFVLFTFSGIFTVEMCAKIFAMGFICHENSYLRSN